MPGDASISRVHTLVTSVIRPGIQTVAALARVRVRRDARAVPTSRCPPPRPTSTSTPTSTSATAAASRVHRARPTARRPPRATTRATPTPTTRDSACSTPRRRAANSSSSPSTRRATTATATASDDARRRDVHRGRGARSRGIREVSNPRAVLRRFRVGGGRDGDDAPQFHRTRDAMRIRGVERRGRRADERGVRGDGCSGRRRGEW